MTTRDVKTSEELDDAAIVDAVRSFIRVQERDWARREMNRVLPVVLREVDRQRSLGNVPHVPSLIRRVFDGKLIQ